MCLNMKDNKSFPSNNASPMKIWSRIFRSPKKPRLQRTIVKSPRVNLNLHWNDFEKEITTKVATQSLAASTACHHQRHVTSVHDADEERLEQIIMQQNTINENLLNEINEKYQQLEM